jgi:hypothetical protein
MRDTFRISAHLGVREGDWIMALRCYGDTSWGWVVDESANCGQSCAFELSVSALVGTVAVIWWEIAVLNVGRASSHRDRGAFALTELRGTTFRWNCRVCPNSRVVIIFTFSEATGRGKPHISPRPPWIFWINKNWKNREFGKEKG